MKNKFLYSSLVLITGLVFTACKNDLDVLAPGEESVSVYGIINPNESVQNIRINKVYLTDGDALTAGQDASQINYGPGELTVTLQRFMSGSETPTLTTVGNASKKEIVLTETVVTTASGNFNQNQRIWQTTDKLYSSGEYKLTIRNNSTGNEFTSQNLVIDSVKSGSYMPLRYLPPFYPAHGQYVNTQPGQTQQSAYVDYSNTGFNQKIRFKSIPNARLYNVIMRFHYQDSLLDGSKVNQYVDFNFPTLKSSTLKGDEDLEVSFLAEYFYTNTATEVAKKSATNVLCRKTGYIEYIIQAGSQSLSDFLQINAPSNSIAQDKPSYSNIKGGVGIFSSRSKFSISKDLWYDFIDKIACHPSTNPYRFLNSANNVSAPCP